MTKTRAKTIVAGGANAEMVERVKAMLRAKAPHLRAENMAVCFDVDECLLQWDGEKSFRRQDVASLFDVSRELGLKRYIITARPKTTGGIQYLRKQLAALGFSPRELEEIYMMPREYDDPGIYKSDARQHIRNKTSRDILLMVGDQSTDIFRSPDRTAATDRMDPNLAYIVAEPDDGVLLGLKLSEVA